MEGSIEAAPSWCNSSHQFHKIYVYNYVCKDLETHKTWVDSSTISLFIILVKMKLHNFFKPAIAQLGIATKNLLDFNLSSLRTFGRKM